MIKKIKNKKNLKFKKRNIFFNIINEIITEYHFEKKLIMKKNFCSCEICDGYLYFF